MGEMTRTQSPCVKHLQLPFFTMMSLKVENPVFFFQEAKSPPCLSNVCRICYVQGRAIGAVGLCSCEGFVEAWKCISR